MAVTVVQKSNAANPGIVWLHITGTAAEVLQELADQRATAGKVVNVADDATSAVMCRAE